MKWKYYPKYKDSGVVWLGDIPEHWQSMPLFSLLHERNQKNIGNSEENVLSLSYGKIIQRDVSDNFGLLPESFETYQIVEPNNIILRLTDLQNDKRSLRVGLVTQRGIITSAYVCLEVQKTEVIDTKYIYYLLHAYDVSKVYYSLGGGVRQSMKFEDLKWLPIISPSLPEQRAIAVFLNREIQRIDQLIAKKERQIELLQEKRTALISHAVTKGLNPKAKMKDSGIEWLGEVPEHWKVIPLRWYFKIGSGEFLSNEAIEYERDEQNNKPVVGGNGVLGFSSNANVFSNTIVVGRVGALCGNVHLVEAPAWITDNALMLMDIRDFNNEYLSLLLRTMNLNRLANQNAQPLVTGGMIKAQKAILPPSEEQDQIVTHCLRETKKIDSLSTRISESIEKLREYRTALISAAVTGKIDVRGVTA